MAFGEIQDMSVDQLAGAIVLVLGSIGSLLLVIWQSRCACKCRIGLSEKCYIFDCQREPPPPEEKAPPKEKKDKDKDTKDKDKKGKGKNKDEALVPKEPSELEYVSDPLPDPDLENPKP